MENYYWFCKDFADGWIKFDDEKTAIQYIKDFGCLAIYTTKNNPILKGVK